MKIGIIGSGIVGRVLATAFLKEGNEVMLGTRNTSKPEVVKWKGDNENGGTGTFADTAAFGDFLVLATSGPVTETAVQLAGIKNFNGKTVIDATNPIAAAPPVNGVIQYFTGPNESLMEKLQALVPEANFVKAFNSVGNSMMYEPNYNGIKPTMFICGNNGEAKKRLLIFWIVLAGKRQILVKRNLQEPLNRWRCFGVSVGSTIINGHMHSNYWNNNFLKTA